MYIGSLNFYSHERNTFTSSYSLISTVCVSYKLAIQIIFKMSNLKVIIKVTPTHEAPESLLSRCAHDSGLVGKVPCKMACIAWRALSTNVGTKRFECDSTGLKMNSANMTIKVAMKTVNHFLNY
jgi:hypothetical protein